MGHDLVWPNGRSNGHSVRRRDAAVAALHPARLGVGRPLRGGGPGTGVSGGCPGPFYPCHGGMLAAYDEALGEADDHDAAAVAARAVLLRYMADDPAGYGELQAAHGLRQTQRSWSVAELYATEFPEQRYLVPGLVTTGLGVLGGRPKIGKGWVALQLAVAGGAGGGLFGERAQRGRVLYLALEDSPRRMKSRLQKQGATAQANVCFEFGWRPLMEGGLDELLHAIDYHRYGLVIVDTLARALGYVDPNKSAEMNLYLGTLQRAAVARNMTILLVDHHRKGNGGAGDVIDDVIGATSKAGVLDVALGLYRARGEKNATLKVTGRDIEERELALRFVRETGCWACLGDAEAIVSSEHDKAILEAIGSLGAPSHKEISDVTGQDRSNCFRRLQELMVKGKVRQIDGRPARFVLATQA